MTGFNSKREAAAEKLQEQWNEDEWRRNNWRCQHGWLRGEQCEICNAPQPAQEPVAWMCSAFDGEPCEQTNHDECGNPIPLYTTPPQPVQPAQERNFCSRCGKRTPDLTAVHTCTPPQEKNG